MAVKIVICVDGGSIAGVYSDVDLNAVVSIIDYDDLLDESSLADLEEGEGELYELLHDKELILEKPGELDSLALNLQRYPHQLY